MSAGDIEQRSVSVVARPERSAGDSGAAQAETDGAGRDSSGTSDGTSTGAATASPEGQEPAGAEVGALRGRSPQPRSAFEEAYALLEEGRRQEALRRFTELYRGPNAQVALDIAELAESLDRAEMARRYYGRAAEATGEGEIRARAERGLFRAAVERQEWERAAAYAETALEQGESPSPEVLLRVGERQAEQNPAGAIKSFEHYLNAVEEAPEKDRVHYMLGRLYERRSPSRNMERALKNYEVVTNDYPLSDYFDRSMQRIRYIERYYVDIR
jgi:tetratricopeptide (TPR) repeat protein